MTQYRLIAAWGLSLLLVIAGDVVQSASDTQQFQVHVPTRISITAPTIDPIRGYPGSGSADLTFAPQTWRARTNSRRGVIVQLETITAFRHVTTPTSKRNAQLDLSVNRIFGPGIWTVNTATSTTNYAAGNEQAKVQLTATGAGEANLLLTVTFMTGVPGTLQEGNYTTTVVGTITEN